MSIRIPSAGSILYDQFAVTSVQVICESLRDLLVTCGWTNTAKGSTVLVTFTGLPSDTQTVALRGNTYTFKTSAGAAPEVQIGGSAAATAANFATVVDAFDSGVTVAQPTSTTVRVTTVATGFAAGSDMAIADNASNVDFTEHNSGFAVGRGFKLSCPATPAGLTGAVWVDEVGGITTYARVRCGSVDETLMSADNTAVNGAAGTGSISVNASRTLEFVGCGHQFFTFLLADSVTGGCKVFFSVPYIRDAHLAAAVTGATNATPIVITQTAHGRTTGEHVYITGVGGNTAANGFWVITVIDANTYSLNGSVGNGAYTSGGLVALSITSSSTPAQIARCMFLIGESTGNGLGSFRMSFNPLNAGSGYQGFVVVNQYSHAIATSSANGVGLVLTRWPEDSGSTNQFQISRTILNWGEIGDLIEPRVAWPINAIGGTIRIIGQLWAAFVAVGEPLPMDRLKTGFADHNWINVTNGVQEPRGSLWLATT